MTFLASDVFDGARVFLNDNAAALFTNTALLPHLKTANEELEQTLVIFGTEVQKVPSTTIAVLAGGTSLTVGGSLPTDFLMPLSIFERTTGDTDQSWTEVTQRDFEPIDRVPTTTFGYYAFRNNGIYFIAATTNRDIRINYLRQLAVITGPSSPVDFYLSKRFLCARVGELAARYIGMNTALANDIKIIEVEPRKDDIERILTLQGQNVRARRPRFTVKQNLVIR